MSQMTKRALEASLKKLLLQKPLNKITISDIAEDCGISRMTFYYHFKDIYDLVEWACVEDAARALAEELGAQALVFLTDVGASSLTATTAKPPWTGWMSSGPRS